MKVEISNPNDEQDLHDCIQERHVLQFWHIDAGRIRQSGWKGCIDLFPKACIVVWIGEQIVYDIAHDRGGGIRASDDSGYGIGHNKRELGGWRS